MFSLRSIHNFFATAFTFYVGGGIGEAALLGAAFGGAKAVVTGEDPLKGALLGGAMGGVTGGIFGPGADVAASATPTATSSLTPTLANATLANETPNYLTQGLTQGVDTTLANATPNYLTQGLNQSVTQGLNQGVAQGVENTGITQGLTGYNGPVAPNFAVNAAPQGIPAAIPSAGLDTSADAMRLLQGSQNVIAPQAVAPSATQGIRDTLGLKPGSWASKGLDIYDSQDTLGRAGIGGGLGGAYGILTKKPNTVAPLKEEKSNLAGYDPNTFTPYDAPMPNPYYQARYAEGGIAAMAGPQGSMYPQSQQDQTQYATPSQMPTSSSVINAGYEAQTDPYTGEPTKGFATGGGIGSLGGYAHGGNPQLLDGPGDGMSDSIPASIGNKQPARLAQGEFVVPADVVSHLGNGSTDAGAKHLYSMMDNIRKARTGNKNQGKQINANKFLPR